MGTINNNLVGVSWMLAFTFLAACNNVLFKYIGSGIHPFVLTFFVAVFSTLICLPLLIIYGKVVFVPKRFWLLFVRGALNAIATLTFYFSLMAIPVATATSLTFVTPVLAVILAAIILKEKVGWRRWTAVLIGFAGVLIILRPGVQPVELGHLSVLVAALAFSFIFVLLRQLGKFDSIPTITIYLGLFMVPLTLVPALFYWSWPNMTELLILMVVGVVSSLLHFCLAAALKASETPVVTPVDYMRLVWVVPIAYIVFGEIPDIFTWIGSIVIFGSATYISIRNYMIERN